MLFKVLGAFANRPFDPSLTEDERIIDVGDVSTCTAYSAYSSSHCMLRYVAYCTSGISGGSTVCCGRADQCSHWICCWDDSRLHHSVL